ncbi:MAG: hypothetical protein ACKVVP_07510 [Chloroflexota bacterium]
MHVVKIRKVGSGNVVSVPSALAASGYCAGQRVIIEELSNGDLLVRRVINHSKQLQANTRRVIEKHRKSLDILEAYDQGLIARPTTEPAGV